MNESEILRRLRELEQENLRLRRSIQESRGTAPKETTTYVSMYKGHPVITFSGGFRPFTLGVKKASIVLEKLEEVRHFVDNNKKHIGEPDDEVDPPPHAYQS